MVRNDRELLEVLRKKYGTVKLQEYVEEVREKIDTLKTRTEVIAARREYLTKVRDLAAEELDNQRKRSTFGGCCVVACAVAILIFNVWWR